MQVLRCPAQIAKAPRRYLDHLCCLWIEIITIARVTLRLKHSSALFQFKTAARRAIKNVAWKHRPYAGSSFPQFLRDHGLDVVPHPKGD
jgi:hypothetical protein